MPSVSKRGATLQLGERDQPEIPGREHHDVGHLVALLAARLHLVVEAGSEHDVTFDGVALHERADQLADAAVLVVDDLGQRPVEVAPTLRRHLGHLDVVLLVDERRHDRLERDAVPLEERRTLGLAVIGQHDDVVRAGRLGDGVFEAGELLIETAERVERGRCEDARVVGHLVVSDEVGVGGGHAAVDVAHQRVQGEVAQDRRRRGPQHRVDPAALEARLDVRPAGSAAIGDLAEHVGDGQRQQSADGIRVRQHVVRRVLAVLAAVGDGAEREDRVGAVAGEHVRP